MQKMCDFAILGMTANPLCELWQVEGTFRDGTKLVTIHTPFCLEDGDLALALHGSFLPGW